MTSRLPEPRPVTVEGAALLEYARGIAYDLENIDPSGEVVSAFTAVDHNLCAWSCEPILATASGVITAGTLYVMKAKAASVAPIASILATFAAAASGATLAKVAVFDSAGIRLGVSADQSTAFNAGGTVTAALTAATRALVLGEDLYLAILSVGGTGPTMRTATAAPALNIGLAAADGYRVGILASQTDMPSSLTLSGLTANTTMQLLVAAP